MRLRSTAFTLVALALLAGCDSATDVPFDVEDVTVDVRVESASAVAVRVTNRSDRDVVDVSLRFEVVDTTTGQPVYGSEAAFDLVSAGTLRGTAVVRSSGDPFPDGSCVTYDLEYRPDGNASREQSTGGTCP